MYNLEFLPIAKNDIDNIIYYISHDLKNTIAAKKLAGDFINVTHNIVEFPYGFAIYNSREALKNEYRCAKVKNFLMFYTINETKKIITIVRVLYQKMDIHSILE